MIESAGRVKPIRRKPNARGTGDSFDARVGALADCIVEDARVKAYEIIGDRGRAVAIMERRLRESPTDGVDS